METVQFAGGDAFHDIRSQAVPTVHKVVWPAEDAPQPLLKAEESYHQRNLDSDVPGPARITDANLVNPWG